MASSDREELAQHLAELCIELRNRRRPINDRWLLYHAAYSGRHTRTFFRSEIFRHFIPAARRAVERFSVRAAQMVVPSADFFEVFPGDIDGTQGDAEANAVRAVLSYVLRKRIRAYLLARRLFRSWACYGRAIVKTSIEVVPGRTEGETQVWPTARVVDPFQFFVYPETVSDPERLSVLVEDFMLPWDHYESLMRQKLVEPLRQEDLGTPEWPDDVVRRLQEQSLNTPTDLTGGDRAGSLTTFVSLSEVWFLRGGRWQRAWLAWNVPEAQRLVRIGESPHPGHPYRIGIARDLPGEHYSTGMMDDLEPMQVLLNDQFNIALEGQATNFSPPTVVDPNRVYRANSLVFRPRAKWLMDPEGVKFFESRDITRYAFQGIQFTLGLMDSFSGSNPLAEGQPTRNLPRAGFAVSSLLNLSMADIKDAAQVVEDAILTPVLADLYRLLVQYTDPKQVLRIPGTQDWPAQRVRADQLVGDWDFQWVGSLQAQDMQIKSQRMVAILGMMGKVGPVVAEDLQRRGKRLNWEAIFKRIWRDGLGERGLDRIVEEMTPEELQQVQQERQMAQMMEMRKKLGGAAQPARQYPRTPEDSDRMDARGMEMPTPQGA